MLKGRPIGYDEMRFVKQCEVGRTDPLFLETMPETIGCYERLYSVPTASVLNRK